MKSSITFIFSILIFLSPILIILSLNIIKAFSVESFAFESFIKFSPLLHNEKMCVLPLDFISATSPIDVLGLSFCLFKS